MRWRLVIEEFGPELKYIKGENNIVADALSRLDMMSDDQFVDKYNGCLEELLAADEDEDFPQNYPTFGHRGDHPSWTLNTGITLSVEALINVD